MTQVAARPHRSPIASLVPGSRGFIAVLSMCMAVTALGIDAVLPAFADIRIAFGLEPGAASVTGLITFFFMGSSLGLLPAFASWPTGLGVARSCGVVWRSMLSAPSDR